MQTVQGTLNISGTALFCATPGYHVALLADAPAFTVAAISDDYAALLPLDPGTLIGKGFFDAFFSDGTGSEAATLLLDSFQQVLHTKTANRISEQSHRWLLQGYCDAPDQRLWHPLSKPVLDAAGAVVGIIYSVEDVSYTEHLAQTTAINQYLQTVIDQSKEPVQVLQPVFDGDEIVDFRYRLTNRAYAAYAGTTPDVLNGKRVSEVFPGYFETSSFSNPVQTYQTGESLTFEIHYDKDGLNLYNRMTTSRVGEDVFIHFTDFSDLKLLQLELEYMVGELRRSNGYLEEFAYAASHDLKDPVRKIQAFSSRLKSSLSSRLSDAEQDVLARLQAAANRMDTLIDDLLAYSAVSRQPAELQLVNLNDVLVQVLHDLDLEMEQTGAQIQLGELCTIPGNRRQWEQVFQNLIGNALKYTKPGEPPLVTINCESVAAHLVESRLTAGDIRPDFHRICIRDNGIGFEQQYAERIFTVFSRLHGRTEYSGSGIGLATVRKVVNDHRGYIWAESSIGQGAAFTILLPVSNRNQKA
ncbi:MAG: two-component sensor histidine kinase [Sphingobacteriales bacterium]|nr:MAG: two-component sensor histidine kinase [Sphingobacteriales bacterium]